LRGGSGTRLSPALARNVFTAAVIELAVITVDRRTFNALWAFTGAVLGVLWILSGVTQSKALAVVALVVSILAFPAIRLLVRRSAP